MVQFPDFLEPWRKAGRALVLHKKIGDVLFSGPTYQIEVKDTLETRWVFLQLEEQQSVKDIFCSCDESTERGSCAHMAAAVLFLFSKTVPLHTRFLSSFWHHLFFMMQEKCGHFKPTIRETVHGYEVVSQEGLLFEAEEDDRLASFFAPKPEETEETSLKFSSLSEEEIDRWREGRPAITLRYELSFLSDMAKWFFLQQEMERSYQIHFVEESKGVPHALHIQSQGVHLHVPLIEAALSTLIPYLPTVTSSLPLIQVPEEYVASIHFDAKKGLFQIEYTKEKLLKGHSFGNWRYLPSVGFFEKEFLKQAEITSFLPKYAALVEKYVAPVVLTPSVPDYELSFDSEKCLHIASQEAHVYPGWSYRSAVGFSKLEPLAFEEVNFVIKPSEIDNFLRQHRVALSQYPGFHVHLSKLQEEIVYDLDEQGALTFHTILQKGGIGKTQLDLGEWIWVKNEGFYIKILRDDAQGLPLDIPIHRHLVADFLRQHLEILQSVPGFFMEECPIKGVLLSIKLQKKGLVEIVPEYEWVLDSYKKQALIYDEYVFIRKKGFYRIPAQLRSIHFMRTISHEDTEVWNAFFEEQLPRLKQEYRCKIDKRLEKAQNLALYMSPQEGGGNTLSEYSLDIFWKSSGGNIVAEELLAAKRKQERYVPTDAGLVDLAEDRFQWLDTLQERKQKKKAAWQFVPTDFLRVQAYDEIHIETGRQKMQEAFRHMLQKLLMQTPLESPQIVSLDCELRPYQQHGVEWLWFLYLNSLSGLLCDDMGVGKTHQAMGLMDAIYHYMKKVGKKSQFLVACPTSLIYHWQDKIKRFLPLFKVKSYVGVARSLDDFSEGYDILLTTYGILRNESKNIRKFLFDAAFFDELQIAKNHVSQVHRALLNVQAHMKVGLTGTPIENQLRELKALFDIILPGYMPPESDFREFFVRPIEKMERPERRVLLSRFVKPFVLRRRKADVLPDLPEKTQEIYYTELLGEQKSLYRTVASMQGSSLIQQLKDESMPIPFMHIFALLSSLKQICNHPASYLKDVANFERYESGKWESFVELLEEAQESEQKVVVFSQYLSMLDIMEAHLKKQKIGYAHIRGQTKLRAEEVNRFHTDPKCTVFLGSLQAAGLGIDLTPASIVIHYDRWWNAAREDQATDRVHRIGQTRGVQVFKLLTKSTIEERIDQMISKKAGLLEDVVSFDDHRMMKKLSRQEILTLLEGLPEE